MKARLYKAYRWFLSLHKKKEKKERKKRGKKMKIKRKKIYEDKFKEILSKSDYPKNTVIKVRIFCNVDNRFYNIKIKL